MLDTEKVHSVACFGAILVFPFALRLKGFYECCQIEMVRDPKEQITRIHVPEEHLNGHAFHTYRVVSPDGMYVISVKPCFYTCKLCSIF